jgi:phage tail protein X
MANTTYKTKPGDRWDLIAWNAYGDAKQIRILTDANPRLPLSGDLPVNATINVPVLEQVQISENNLPPWKR